MWQEGFTDMGYAGRMENDVVVHQPLTSLKSFFVLHVRT